MSTLTIHDIKRLTAETAPCFFNRETLKFFGQTMKSFSVYKQKDGTYLISAPSYWDGKLIGYTRRVFNPKDNTLTAVVE